MKLLRKIKSAHNFFMTEGMDFVKVKRPSYDEFTDSWFLEEYISDKDRRYAPIAYMKFMYYSIFNR